MRKIVLLIVLWCIKTNFVAQVVFCPPGAVWKSAFSGMNFREYETVQYTATTVINADTVKQLSHKRFFMSTNYGGLTKSYIKQKGDTVFVMNSMTFNSWQILYNFAAQPGDTWENKLNHFNNTVIDYTTTVISIQTITINGFPLKQLSLNQINKGGISSATNNFTYTLNERLGSNYFLFPFNGKLPGSYEGDWFNINVCYTDGVFGTFYYNGKNCLDQGVETNINDLNDLDGIVEIYPNPTKEIINCKLKMINEDFELLFIDIYGRELKRVKVTNQNQIDVADLNAGIYFITLVQNNRVVEKQKLVIMK